MSDRTIYLDHAATTALDTRVLDAMIPYLTTEYGNASSIYTLGRHAMQAIDSAREQVADILNSRPTEVTFTGCGSESDKDRKSTRLNSSHSQISYAVFCLK